MFSKISSKLSRQPSSQAATSDDKTNGVTLPYSWQPAPGQLGPNLPNISSEAQSHFEKANIPLISCSACPSPCDPLHEDATPEDILDSKLLSTWSKQDIEWEGEMLGSNSPFLRHVLISTGKRDWTHDIASVEGSLAQLFERWNGEVCEQIVKEKEEVRREETGRGGGEEPPKLPRGCWQTTYPPSRPNRLLIGNNSQVSSSSHAHGQSVMLLPDYTMISNVPDATDDSTKADDEQWARQAFDAYISPRAPAVFAATSDHQLPPSKTRKYVLPYKAIVVLCSHKKRDARCGIVAPLLAEVFKRYAHAQEWEVDERGDDIGEEAGDEQDDVKWSEMAGVVINRGWGYIHPTSHPGDEDPSKTCPQAQSATWRKLLASYSSQQVSDLPHTPPPTLGIFYTSHIGKHKWAGNCLIYLPNGASVWYGKVDPREGVGRVWSETIIKGNVIPEYLRLGINLYRGSHGQRKEIGDAGDEETRVSGSLAQMNLGDEGQGILRW